MSKKHFIALADALKETRPPVMDGLTQGSQTETENRAAICNGRRWFPPSPMSARPRMPTSTGSVGWNTSPASAARTAGRCQHDVVLGHCRLRRLAPRLPAMCEGRGPRGQAERADSALRCADVGAEMSTKLHPTLLLIRHGQRWRDELTEEGKAILVRAMCHLIDDKQRGRSSVARWWRSLC